MGNIKKKRERERWLKTLSRFTLKHSEGLQIQDTELKGAVLSSHSLECNSRKWSQNFSCLNVLQAHWKYLKETGSAELFLK